MLVKLDDIAKSLGLSLSTVSRALNNHASVSEATRKRVMEAAEKMGYRPHIIAKGLALNRTYSLEVTASPGLSNFLFSFLAETTMGILDEANSNGYNLGLFSNFSG